jgi:hypothetical protein
MGSHIRKAPGQRGSHPARKDDQIAAERLIRSRTSPAAPSRAGNAARGARRAPGGRGACSDGRSRQFRQTPPAGRAAARRAAASQSPASQPGQDRVALRGSRSQPVHPLPRLRIQLWFGLQRHHRHPRHRDGGHQHGHGHGRGLGQPREVHGEQAPAAPVNNAGNAGPPRAPAGPATTPARPRDASPARPGTGRLPSCRPLARPDARPARHQ